MTIRKAITGAFAFVLMAGAFFLVLNPVSAALSDYNIRTAVSGGFEGGQDDYWHLRPVNEKSEFYIGEKVQFFAQSDQINVAHTWSMRLYLDGNEYRYIKDYYNPGYYGWNYSNFIPTIDGLPSGNYQVDYFLDSGSGNEFINSIHFKVLDQLRPDLEPYLFSYAVTALDFQHGVGNEYWNLKPVQQKSEFSVGDEVKLLVQVKDIYVKHRYKVELYKDDVKQWDNTTEFFNVGEKWAYGNFFPSYHDAQPGNYRFKVYIDIGNGFMDLANVAFSVTGQVKQYTYSHTYLATGWEHGEGDAYWDLKPVNAGSNFSQGDTVYALSQVRNIYQDHRWKVELFKDGKKLWDYTTAMIDVSSKWEYSNFFPAQYNAAPGNYTFKIYLDSGAGFILLDSKNFSVASTNNELSFYRAVTASGWVHGEGEEYWNLEPTGQSSTFYVGDRIYLMTQLRDVYVDHRYKVALYKDSKMLWEYDSGQLDVGTGWKYSNFYPYLNNAEAGNYEFWYYLDSGSGFKLYGKVPFSVIGETPETSSLFDVATDAGNLQTFLAAISAAGLTNEMKTGGPYTLFVPNDEAFAKLPEGTLDSLLNDIPTLKNILLYHAVSGRKDAATISTLHTLTTLEGGALTIDTSEGVKVNDSMVITPDIMADNGIIHVIDTVLLP